MDLFIPRPSAIKAKVDVAELLKDLGFVVGFTGSKGYIRLQHPQLIVEFLVPERGKGSDEPYSLPPTGLKCSAAEVLGISRPKYPHNKSRGNYGYSASSS